MITIISDLDGVMMGRARYRNGDGRDGLSHFASLLSILDQIKPYRLIFLTDRGVDQLAPLVYLLHASEFHGGESGALAYCASTHNSIVNPKFQELTKIIPEIRKNFLQQFWGVPIEPGVRSSLRVERVDGESLKGPHDFLVGVAEEYPQLICSDHGDCISLKPKNIHKGIGMQWLEDLYIQDGKPIDFASSFWMGDGISDIVVAAYVLERGGRIASVGNGDPLYKKFIAENDGYIAENCFTAGAVEIIRHLAL
jgi:hypothetical protein